MGTEDALYLARDVMGGLVACAFTGDVVADALNPLIPWSPFIPFIVFLFVFDDGDGNENEFRFFAAYKSLSCLSWRSCLNRLSRKSDF